MAAAAEETVPTLDEIFLERMVQDMVHLVQNYNDSNQEPPGALLSLQKMADSDAGWMQVIHAMIKVIPLDNPMGAPSFKIFFTDCPLVTKPVVQEFIKNLNLSEEVILEDDVALQKCRNICIVLGCIAEIMVGFNGDGVMTEEVVQYLLTILNTRKEPYLVLHALIALEKFGHKSDNKQIIEEALKMQEENILIKIELTSDENDYEWRQVKLCASWLLDNLFICPERKFTYQTTDMKNTNVILHKKYDTEYLKLSSNGLEVRSDSYIFESIRSTFVIRKSCWYYECTIITSGVMQIGWASRDSLFLNQTPEYVNIRTTDMDFARIRQICDEDMYSVSIDGSRGILWYGTDFKKIEWPVWKQGDIVGCLVDFDNREAVFSLNGDHFVSCYDIREFKCIGFFAAVSFTAFQQCRLNFGNTPFKYPPTNRGFEIMNDKGTLKPEEKTIIPGHLSAAKIIKPRIPMGNEKDLCPICNDCYILCYAGPCKHEFCMRCKYKMIDCPYCRSEIVFYENEYYYLLI